MKKTWIFRKLKKKRSIWKFLKKSEWRNPISIEIGFEYGNFIQVGEATFEIFY